MRRVFWVAAGAAIAVGVLYQVGRAASAASSAAKTLTPQGFSAALTAGVAELRVLGADLAAAMREQEDRLSRDFLPDPRDEAAARTRRANSAQPRPSSAWDAGDEDF